MDETTSKRETNPTIRQSAHIIITPFRSDVTFKSDIESESGCTTEDFPVPCLLNKQHHQKRYKTISLNTYLVNRVRRKSIHYRVYCTFTLLTVICKNFTKNKLISVRNTEWAQKINEIKR